MPGEDPVGTLECPPGFVLDENLGMCVPENPLIQAEVKEKSAVEVTSKPFNNFFIVDGGKAIDKGNSKPKNTKSSDQKNFVLVIESNSGGNKTSSISAVDVSEARTKAMNSAKRNSDARVVILARRVGTLDGKPLFKDIVGFKPKKVKESGNQCKSYFSKLSDPNSSITEAQMNFQPSDKMERCIQNVKSVMRKRRGKMKEKDLKSTAIAICRSRLGK